MTVHDKFLADLDESQASKWAAAYWLVEKMKVTVAIPPSTRAERYEDRHEHSDDGDIFMRQRPGMPWQLVEAKWTPGYDWEDYDTWPYKRQMFVTNVHSYRPDTHMFIKLNNRLSHAAVVMNSTKDHWFVVHDVPDSAGGEPKDVYAIDATHVTFHDLGQS